jgi:hypothetical protein
MPRHKHLDNRARAAALALASAKSLDQVHAVHLTHLKVRSTRSVQHGSVIARTSGQGGLCYKACKESRNERNC